MRGKNVEIEVKIRGLMMDPSSGTPIIILKDVNSDMMLPIWVGAYEANAIALEIEKITPQRPMTHDLIRNLISLIGAKVERVVVTELRDNNNEALILDARPSDAIALALRADCPIFVDEEVVRTSRNTVTADMEDEDTSEDEWPDVIGEAGDLPM
jgi:bifunctional DNase/RNase